MHPLEGDPHCLPLQWGIMHFRLLHGLYYPVDSVGAQDDWNSSGKSTGIIQDEEDLLFIVVRHPLYLDPHQGEACRLHTTTA